MTFFLALQFHQQPYFEPSILEVEVYIVLSNIKPSHSYVHFTCYSPCLGATYFMCKQ